MKIIITILITLLFSLIVIFEGCYSYIPFKKTENNVMIPQNDECAVITLTDGSRIETDSYRHFEVTESLEIVSGYGMKCRGNIIIKEFCGTIDVTLLDSLGMSTIGNDRYFVCWFKDGTYIKFKDEDYLYINKNSEKGFWCVGTMEAGEEESVFKGIIKPDNIKEIQIKKIAIGKTSALVFAALSPIIIITIFLLTWSGPG